MNDVEQLGLISAIWIMASNDESHLITYEGIRSRLALDSQFDIRGLIRKHPELFRPGVNSNQLEEWKARMKSGKSIPAWLHAFESADREARINSLSANDVFRSQFRAARDAEKSEIEILQWGLEHLDRLRKARAEARDASAKAWQIWLVFAIGVAGIVTQLVVAWLKK